MHALGRRLYGRGRIRPPCLLDAANAQEAGHALVATMALELLEHPQLSAAERAILLELLLRAPCSGTRARVHRLLRHRDRHVRKQVIALLARDAGGDDAEALSATLIALTAAQDVQTVRQALSALGHARARWAAGAVARCLDHPNTNIKKTAASVLVRAGAPAAVPNLLAWLGRHDNPGLRTTLIEALRAVLGDAYATTVLAAAEQADDARSRELLLAGLDRALSARSVLALDDQASPVATTLLTLAVTGRLALAEGSADDLAGRAAEHGIAVPTPGRAPDDKALDPEITSLLTDGWNPSVALAIAARDEPPHPERLRELRPMLADWLRLAATAPFARNKVLNLVLRLCPAPWTDAEAAVFARSTGPLLDALRGPTRAGDDRHALLTVLEAVAPVLHPAQRLAVADAVRTLSPSDTPLPTMPLLRRCDAVLVRADLERDLAAARLGADPWQAETAVLRDAFGLPRSPAPPGDDAWRTALEAAVRAPAGPVELRGLCDGATDSGACLAALADVYPTAAPGTRDALLDLMTELQPLGTPPWSIGETFGAQEPAPRTVRNDDLDQPRSTALLERLLTMLDASAADRRDTAARELTAWPEPGVRRAVLRAYLRGRVTLPPGAGPAPALLLLDEAELRAEDVMPERLLRTALELAPHELTPLLPLLLDLWENGPPELRTLAARAVRRAPADTLAQCLGTRLEAGAHGFVDLLAGLPLLRTPALTRVLARLRAEGRDDLADAIRLVDGPLRSPGTTPQDAFAAVGLRAPATARGRDSGPRRPARQDLLDLARTGTPEQIRRALTLLAQEHSGPAAAQDPQLRAVIADLLKHPRPKVRLHAHRTSRAMLDRQTHLHHVSILLEDPQPDVRRMAIRTLCHAAWQPAVPAVVGMLDHAHPVVRRAAAEGLVTLGAPAVPALRHAADHARPDKRSLYTDVLGRITQA